MKAINHAGNELVDFITTYVSRYITKNSIKKDLMNHEKMSEEEANKYIEHGLIIKFPEHGIIKPVEILKEKIYRED